MSSETEDGEIHVADDVSPGETVTISLTDGLVDADVTVNGELVTPSDADEEIGVVVPDNDEVTIIIEAEHATYEISLAGSETGTEVSSSTLSADSSTSTSTSTSTSSPSPSTST